MSSARKWIEVKDVMLNIVKPSPKDWYHMTSLSYVEIRRKKDDLKLTEGLLGRGKGLGKEEGVTESG